MSEKLIYADALLEAGKNTSEFQQHLASVYDLECLVMGAPVVDAVEVVRKESVDYGYLADWYIRSVMNDDPVWTEDHIKELFDDFYLVPKDNGERRTENAVHNGKGN